jgi:DNA-binding NtrC family response regulator
MKPRILLVDDEPAILFGFSKFLSQVGYDVKEASCLSEAREALRSEEFNAVILDLMLPDGNGIDWIPDLRATVPDIAIIVVTGGGDIPVAVEAMRRGADNFLTKPINMVDIDVFLRKSLELQNLRRSYLSNQRLQKEVRLYFGNSTVMKKLRELATMAAENNLPVLLQGETGTGKSMLARWIHDQSDRRVLPFVELSCSSLRGDLLVSELFGHARGAFTSAVQDRQGLIGVSDGGTLFLDEIGDMDVSVQAQFLKVIEEKQYRRLGEVKVRQSDFRLLCATNKNLEEETIKGGFRQDLYFRINVFPLVIPPLRDRREDMDGLIRHILSDLDPHYTDVSDEVRKLLADYSWPGNIRELRNVLERAYILARGGMLLPEHLPGIGSSSAAGHSLPITDMDRMEKDHIAAAMRSSGGDVKKAAAALGMSKATLYRKLKKYHISS